jgi:hypothetical protein
MGRAWRQEGGWQGVREAHSQGWAVTTKQRGQLPFCLAPSTVALILALAFVARLTEIATDIATALRALANAKIHSNAAHPSISTVS